jgi:hypothetical protein
MFEEEAKERKEERELNSAKRSCEAHFQDCTTIKLLEVSPNATFLVAHIENEILIRIINQTGRGQWGNTYEYQNSLMFMPMFLDEDYNFAANKRRYEAESVKLRSYRQFGQNLHESVCGTIDGGCEGENGALLKSRDVVNAIKLFDTLTKHGSGNIYVKNALILELYQFYLAFKRNPRIVLLPPLSLRITKDKISSIFEMLRTF